MTHFCLTALMCLEQDERNCHCRVKCKKLVSNVLILIVVEYDAIRVTFLITMNHTSINHREIDQPETPKPCSDNLKDKDFMCHLCQKEKGAVSVNRNYRYPVILCQSCVIQREKLIRQKV